MRYTATLCGLAAAGALTIAGCGAVTHPAKPAAAVAPVASSKPLPCHAAMSIRRPAGHATDLLEIRTASRAKVTTVAHYKTASRKTTGQSGRRGRLSLPLYIGGSAAWGHKVIITVTVVSGLRSGQCSTWFAPRPKKTPAAPAPTPTPTQSLPTPSPSPPPPPKPAHHAAPRPAAWCSATASVYNAARNENNVYVHSNQPYRSATASADGHSWSYETNGSGYAEIYLNGPPPGAQVTVTVGAATCTTSD